MAKPTEKLPLQFYVQHYPHSSERDASAAQDSADALATLNDEVASKLKATYQTLWTILSDFASQWSMGAREQRLASTYLFHQHRVTGHPDVFMRCEIVDKKWLALVLEQSIAADAFSGRAGLILGARGTSKSSLLREFRAQPTIELDLTDSTRRFRVHSSTLQSHADQLLATLLSDPAEIARVHDWFEETEKVVSVPESSLRETTEWLIAINREIAADREASQARAESQNAAFMRMFATLANPRMGA